MCVIEKKTSFQKIQKALIFSVFLLLPVLLPAGNDIDYPKEIEQLLSDENKINLEKFKKLIREWTKKNSEEALDWIIKLLGKENLKSAALGEAEKILVTAAIERGQHEPEAALEWIRKKGNIPANIYHKYLCGVYTGWAELNLKAATDTALAEKKVFDKRMALAGIAIHLVKDNPSEACKWALSLNDPNLKNLMVPFVAIKWCQKDPKAANEWVLKQDDPNLKKMALTSIVSDLAKKDPQATAKLLQNIKSDESFLFYELAGEWYKRDPKAAKEWALSLSPEKARTSALDGLLHAISKNNPPEATALIPLFPEGESRVKACGDLASSWAEKDLDSATKWLLSITDEKEKKKAINDIAFSLASEPEKGTKWVLFLPEGTLRDYAIKEFAESWALKLPPGKAWNCAVAGVAGGWAKNNPESAAKWAKNVSDETGYETALVIAMSVWAMKEPLVAEKFVYSLPPGKARSGTFVMIGGAKAEKNKDEALKWALAFKSQEDRVAAIAGVSLLAAFQEDAGSFDLDKAMEWIRSLNIPDSEKDLSVEILRKWYASILLFEN